MSLLLTSLLMSMIAAVWVWIMGRKDPCGRPWLTTLCLALLLVLPGLAMLPKVRVEMSHVQGLGSENAGVWGASEYLTFLWAVMALVMVLRMVRNIWILKKWITASDPADCHGWQSLIGECSEMLGLKKMPELRVKTGLSSPVVAGLIRPVILLPATSTEWNEGTRKMAILHELGHVQRRDLWVRLAAEFACALHWYNPLVWWLRAKLLTQCEYACDALVVEAGADRRSYIRALCDVVESALTENRPQGVLAMADHAPLKLRVDRLLGGARMGNPSWAIVAAVLTTTSALALTLVRPAYEVTHPEQGSPIYTQSEIDLRHSADPFPSE
ncbi:hypothetical protein NT6N_12230 [Oceaniferula spumae]|uniref:Peptidase M56 domain-containing protein n=1 Tax=Oceaniferula spumae TaxID=2979115 RepID=A0AAT9FJP3_9BACT